MVGALEDILMDEEFGALQKAFMDKNAGEWGEVRRQGLWRRPLDDKILSTPP